MRSKWEYIRDACRELGYEEAAGIAGEIEEVLKEIYGDTKTIAWMRDYTSINVESATSISVLASTTEYCIACMEGGCTTCRFRKRGGGCAGDTALFGRFIKALHIADRRE